MTRLLLWFLVFPRLARWVLALAAWTGLVMAAVAAAPVTMVAVAGLAVAWGRGWPPARLRRAAAWSLSMTGTWLLVTAVTTRSVSAVLGAPFTGWAASWHAFSYGAATAAFVLAAPVAVPAGLLIASWAWQVRIYRIETGLGGADRHRAGRLRPAAVAPPGQYRCAPEHRPRSGAADRPAGQDRDRRHDPRGRPPMAARARHPRCRSGPSPGGHRIVRSWLALRLSLIGVCRTVQPGRV